MIHGWHAHVLYAQRHYDEAIAAAQELLRIQPDFPYGTQLLWWTWHEEKGMEKEAIEAVADGFKRIAPYAEEKGVNLNMELLNSKVNHPGYQCDNTNWGVAVCEKVNSPRVKLLYDIYHMQIMEGDIIRTIRENIKWIGHFHTAGNPGRNDMDRLARVSCRHRPNPVASHRRVH